MFVCIHTRVRNFYLINNKFDIYIGLVKSKVKFEDGISETHKNTSGHPQITNYILNLNNLLIAGLIFDLKVSLDRTHQNL